VTLRACPDCHASWDTDVDEGDWCGWCDAVATRQRATNRSLLLDPPSLRTSAGDPRYDALSDVDKRIWDRTRGQARGADSIVSWAARLRRAVETELITAAEAEAAMRRATR